MFAVKTSVMDSISKRNGEKAKQSVMPEIMKQ